MKNIYKGQMRQLVVSKLEIQDGAVRLMEYETPVVKRDLTFYRGFLNRFISFEYGTRLPDQEEAMDFVSDTAMKHQMTEAPYPTCSFVNESEIEYSHSICDKNFKVLKKYYKKLRKDERKKK